MEKTEYQIIQDLVIMKAEEAVIIDLDFESFLNAQSYTESVGPILDPTLYIKGADRMKTIGKLARAYQEFTDVSKELLEKLK